MLATKFGSQGGDMGYGPAAGAKGSRAYIRRAVERSLRRLRTDYIDLYQIHTPDPITPIDETLTALTELVQSGHVRYIGHSNFSAAQIATAAATAREFNTVPFISAQNHWSLLERQAELDIVPAAIEFGLGVLPFFPLANGLLTGKVRRGVPPPAGSRLADRADYITDKKLDKIEALAGWADQTRPDVAGGCHRWSRRGAGLRVGYRRGDLARSGQGQRRGGRVGANPEELAQIDELVPIFG